MPHHATRGQTDRHIHAHENTHRHAYENTHTHTYKYTYDVHVQKQFKETRHTGWCTWFKNTQWNFYAIHGIVTWMHRRKKKNDTFGTLEAGTITLIFMLNYSTSSMGFIDSVVIL